MHMGMSLEQAKAHKGRGGGGALTRRNGGGVALTRQVPSLISASCTEARKSSETLLRLHSLPAWGSARVPGMGLAELVVMPRQDGQAFSRPGNAPRARQSAFPAKPPFQTQDARPACALTPSFGIWKYGSPQKHSPFHPGKFSKKVPSEFLGGGWGIGTRLGPFGGGGG